MSSPLVVKSEKKGKDFEYSIELTRKLLLPFGLWPVRYSEIYERYLRPILFVACLFSMLFLTIPLCLFIFIKISDMKIRLKLTGPLAFSLMNIFKYIAIVARKEEFRKCIESIGKDWEELSSRSHRHIMLENAKTGRKLTVCCVFLMYIGGMPYITLIPFYKGATIVANVSHRSLAYPAYFLFFNPHVSPYYHFVFPFQIICACIRYTITCGVYSTIIVCIMHISSRITITSMMLQNFPDDLHNNRLGNVVKEHLRFFKLASQLEKVFKEICLVEVLGSTFILCFLGYSIITEYEEREGIATLTYCFLLSSFIFNIFILCYIGQILTDQCESIGMSAYMMDWHKLSDREARNMILMLLFSQRRVRITAGNMMSLSLRSFTGIVKTAGAYFNMIRTVTANYDH